jgi:tRNA(adenine34) deaminase
MPDQDGPGYAAAFEPAMRLALAEAALAAGSADVPVGAVVLDEAGAVLARAHNRRQADQDPTAHAEILAIRQAARALGRWRLTDLTLVVTLEPCTMCAGAVTAARLGRLVYGAEDPKAGAVGSLWDVLRDRRLNHHPEVIGGVLAEECGAALREFFAARRRSGLPGAPVAVSSPAVESPSGRGRTPRKRVRGQPLRGFKSHLHRRAETAWLAGPGNFSVMSGRSLPRIAC